MAAALTLSLLAVSMLLRSSNAQCPNQVYNFNENLRTASSNTTAFIVPAKKDVVQKALDSFYGTDPLLGSNVLLADVPADDTTLFPSGFDSDYHPLLVYSGYQSDIRMGPAQIDTGALTGAGLYVPFVHRRSKTDILQAPLSDFITGGNDNAVAGIVPSTVSTLVEGYFLKLAKVIPSIAAFQLNDGGVLSFNCAWLIIKNGLSGPGIYEEAYDFQFTKQTGFTLYTPKLFKLVLNLPSILSGVQYFPLYKCQRNQYYFNNATSIMTPVMGNVTFGPAADGLGLQTSSTIQAAMSGGVYDGNEGFTACGQNVGFNVEPCDQAAKNVDPAAL